MLSPSIRDLIAKLPDKAPIVTSVDSTSYVKVTTALGRTRRISISNLFAGIDIQPVAQNYGAVTGTVSRTAYTVYTAPDISTEYTEAEVQAIATALALLSSKVGAILTDIRASGLVGSA